MCDAVMIHFVSQSTCYRFLSDRPLGRVMGYYCGPLAAPAGAPVRGAGIGLVSAGLSGQT